MYKIYLLKDLKGLKIHYDSQGKPYIDKYNISISTKEGYYIIVLSPKKVGIDVEKITYRKRVIKHSFKKEEYPQNKIEFTYRWTLKEAYSKLLGQGLSYGFKNIDTNKIKNKQIYQYKNYIISIVWSE